MSTTVGRVYRFRATHSLPRFPEPWCFRHEHDYRVEVEAKGGTSTDYIDNWWEAHQSSVPDLNRRFDPSTVENIAQILLSETPEWAVSVTVWEDDARWGTARR